jgi:hypothetical protein
MLTIHDKNMCTTSRDQAHAEKEETGYQPTVLMLAQRQYHTTV